MILAVPLRTLSLPERKTWGNLYYLCDHFKLVFDELNITLFPVFTPVQAAEIEPLCDGLVLSGSDKNIYPEHYGHTRSPEMAHTYTVDEYTEDARLIEAFVRSGKPILGICGGIQSLNVYFGGTLIQKVAGHSVGENAHHLRIAKDSFIYRVYGSETALVNTYHSQCVGDVAPGFTASAWSEDGTVEAIERENIIGVQWHPEVSHEMNFFHAFIAAFLKK